MKRAKKKSLNWIAMLRESWLADGHAIGKLRLAGRHLAERLAEAGLRPEGCPGIDLDVPGLAMAWIQAADIDAAMTYEQRRG